MWEWMKGGKKITKRGVGGGGGERERLGARTRNAGTLKLFKFFWLDALRARCWPFFFSGGGGGPGWHFFTEVCSKNSKGARKGEEEKKEDEEEEEERRRRRRRKRKKKRKEKQVDESVVATGCTRGLSGLNEVYSHNMNINLTDRQA